MRNAFADEIRKLAHEDERIVLLSGDIGNRLFDAFKTDFPNRFYNCGVAEANMINMAAGLAMTGMRPVVYTIASFLVFRPFEQIRVNLGYHNLPVLLVGVGGGLSYASNGPTHHAVEDLAAIRCIPEFGIESAGDAFEVRAALQQLTKSEGPKYLRIGKKNEPAVHEAFPETYKVGKALPLKEFVAPKAALLAHGNLLPRAVTVIKNLEKQGVEIELYNYHSLRPFDTETLNSICSKVDTIFTLEEHSIAGALGSIVAEYLAERAPSQARPRLKRIGVPEAFIKRTTDQEDARTFVGLGEESILNSILDTLS